MATQPHNGLDNRLDNLFLLSDAKSRSISPENFTGEKGKGGMATEGTGAKAARDLGQGWKISPSVVIEEGATFTLGEIKESGAINHIWMTPTGNWRFLVFRVYYDGEETPSIEVPLGDFFACGLGEYAPIVSAPICVNPGSALNSFWQMPFRKSCKLTVENLSPKPVTLFYQIDYTLTDVPENAAYLHAQFRRVNPLPYKDVYTILDGVKGKGQYVGTYLIQGVNNNGWWGEGEVKFYLDGDDEFPTICGTGAEDYFLGSYDFENQVTHEYERFSTPYAGLTEIKKPDGLYKSQQRFGMYRWHIVDPIRFAEDIRVTMQALSWRSDGRYLPLQDDISSVAFWYQSEPHAPFPTLPAKDELEII
ncbi:MAG: DUF2961 domain-containing protein [Ignavibacteriales bacterium]|nr:DUF2961 domain-containing protein [Ignavibacteriales bacterium]